jgi:uncharacterized repeat protein (TIGR03803 family)
MERNKSLARSVTVGTCVFLLVLVTGAAAQTYSILTSFNGANGRYIYATPLIDASGNLFGTTNGGGVYGCGVVYELVNNGGGSYTNNTLYNFTCGDDGGNPYGGVVEDSDGDLYGTTDEYGAYGVGVVFELVNLSGSTYGYEVLYAFTGAADGGYPLGDLAWFDGSLYGMTDEGGGGGCRYGCGTVYRLSKKDAGWTETVLHRFSYPHDGYYPDAGVIVDSEGNIYGTTYEGGSFGLGTVFRLAPATGFKSPGVDYTETILHSFDGALDGCSLDSGVAMDRNGNLYGTTSECGLNDDGTVYELKRSGGKYVFSVLLQFDYTNGADPYDEPGHVAVDSAGNVYGTAEYGGLYEEGLVFRLAAGTFAYTDLHDFDDNGTDGYYPYGGVSLDSYGNLYGTTFYGGTTAYGTVWEIANPSE